MCAIIITRARRNFKFFKEKIYEKAVKTDSI